MPIKKTLAAAVAAVFMAPLGAGATLAVNINRSTADAVESMLFARGRSPEGPAEREHYQRDHRAYPAGTVHEERRRDTEIRTGEPAHPGEMRPQPNPRPGQPLYDELDQDPGRRGPQDQTVPGRGTGDRPGGTGR